MKSRSLYSLAIGTAVVAAGCGGGSMESLTGIQSGPSGATQAKISPSVNAFATSTRDTRFSHAWVKLYSVDLVNSAGTVTRVFSNGTGRTLDLAQLQDAKGPLFSFLNSSAIAAQSFTSIKIRMARSASLVGTGQKMGVSRQFSSDFNDPRNTAITSVTIPLSSAISVASPGQKVVVDLNVRGWVIDSKGAIRPQMHIGSTTGSDDPARQEAEDFNGLVAGLTGTAPIQSFTIGSVTVNTDANTKIFNSNGAANPVLANGEKVEARGVFANGVLSATEIKIEIGDGAGDNGGGHAEAHGTASSLDPTNGTFTLTIQDAEDFIPGATTVPVVTNTNTKFLLGGNAVAEADFFAALAAAPAATEVEAVGSFDGTTFTATMVKAEIENETGGGGTSGGGESGGGGGDGKMMRHR